MIQLFDIKTRTLGFAFCQPQKKSLPKSLTQKKSLQNFKPKKSPQIANFKPKKGLRTSPSLIYLSTPLVPWGVVPLPGDRSQRKTKKNLLNQGKNQAIIKSRVKVKKGGKNPGGHPLIWWRESRGASPYMVERVPGRHPVIWWGESALTVYSFVSWKLNPIIQ